MKDLKLRYKNLKEEHSSFRDPADKMIAEKDKEISRLIDMADDNDNYNTGTYKQDTSNSAAEQQILILARQQAQREEELAQSPRHILALQKEIEELERENRLHSPQESMLKVELHNMERTQKREGVDMTYPKNVILKLLETGMYKQDASSISNSAAEQQILISQREEELAQSQRHILALQESMLKAELRNMERMQKREGVDMTYLKNVILKLLETGEVEALLPVVGMLLQFSPDEVKFLSPMLQLQYRSVNKRTEHPEMFLLAQRVMLQDQRLLFSQDSHFHDHRSEIVENSLHGNWLLQLTNCLPPDSKVEGAVIVNIVFFCNGEPLFYQHCPENVKYNRAIVRHEEIERGINLNSSQIVEPPQRQIFVFDYASRSRREV
ncbi:hypothetical protein ACE6H2_024881 [Prunus campanulata]